LMNNCEQFEDLIVEEALGEISEKDHAALKKHLEACPACRGRLAELSDAVGAARRDKPERAPAGLAERTFHRVGSVGERLVSAAESFEGTELLRPSTWQVRRSLVGWLVAASILVMAVATLVPGLSGTYGDKRVARCQDNLRLVGMALRQYARDHGGFYPSGAQWYEELDYDFLRRHNALLCPARIAVGQPGERRVDYVYAPGRLNVHADPQYPLLWDRKGMHERPGRNVLFAGGRVTWVSEDEFQTILARFRIDESEATAER